MRIRSKNHENSIKTIVYTSRKSKHPVTNYKKQCKSNQRMQKLDPLIVHTSRQIEKSCQTSSKNHAKNQITFRARGSQRTSSDLRANIFIVFSSNEQQITNNE